MVTRSQKIRLGIFLTVSVIALLAVLGVILVPKYLEVRDTYYIGFRDISITGLIEGGSVKYHGLTVGFVSRIFIDPEDIRRVIVEVSLEHGTPIKEDTRAEIAFLGITGLKLIELRSGSRTAESLKPGSFIKPGQSITEQITGRAEVIADKTEIVLNNIAALTNPENREKLFALSDNASNALNELYDILNKNNVSFSTTIRNAELASAELQETVAVARRTMNTVRDIARSDSVKLIISNMAQFSENLKEADLVRLFEELNKTLDRTNNMMAQLENSFSKSNADIIATIESLRETVDNLNQFSRLISEDPSILVRGGKPKGAPDYRLER
ncbi:MCE family protein [candidate division KSB1 bacterium]|nr:MCE family protein [candidate division KSB1 bacterium]